MIRHTVVPRQNNPNKNMAKEEKVQSSEQAKITDIAIAVLKELQLRDPAACNELLNFRVGVAKSAPDAKTTLITTPSGKGLKTGPLAVINSILQQFGADGVALMVYNDRVAGFTRLPQDQIP